MKKNLLAIFTFVIGCLSSNAQVKIGDNPDTISPGSILELESTSRALTLPRMTTLQMQAIPSPLSGMMIFNTDSNCIYLYKNNNLWAGITTEAPAEAWPYQSSDEVVGPGNGKGIIALTGSGLSASGNYSHAEGVNSVSSGVHSWSSGYADTAAAPGAVAMGFQNRALGAYSVAMGYNNVTGYQSGVAFGQGNTDSGWASLAMGVSNKIANLVSYSNALGYNNQLNGGVSNNVFGEANFINGGRANTGAGYANIITTGNFTSAFGTGNDVIAGNSHIAAGENNTVRSGNANSIFGLENIADGNYLGAIGKDNTVFYQSAIALGQGNRDSGFASIAGGLNNIIEKNIQYSASFGYNNRSTRNIFLPSSGSGTFTAGINNLNSGYCSFALGSVNLSSNVFSLAANHGTLANSNAMSAFGHYSDTISALPGESYEQNEMLFSIGNGFNSSNRRNSFTMLRNGYTTINTTGNNGAHVPRADLDIQGTGAIIVPVGTTAERPATPVVGMIRFCTDCPGGPVLQGYDGSNWVNL